jgi:hypothetical protein
MDPLTNVDTDLASAIETGLPTLVNQQLGHPVEPPSMDYPNLLVYTYVVGTHIYYLPKKRDKLFTMSTAPVFQEQYKTKY